MYCLSQVMKTISAGYTYATFGGLCIIATTIIGILRFNQWPKNLHPSKNLTNSNVTLNKISLFHPEVNNTKKIRNNLIQSDLIDIFEGLPKLEFHRKTKNDRIVIE